MSHTVSQASCLSTDWIHRSKSRRQESHCVVFPISLSHYGLTLQTISTNNSVKRDSRNTTMNPDPAFSPFSERNNVVV